MSRWAAAEQNARKDVFHQMFPSHFITLSPYNDIRAAGKPRWDHYRCEADNEKKISRFQAEHERNEINKSEISLIRILKDKDLESSSYDARKKFKMCGAPRNLADKSSQSGCFKERQNEGTSRGKFLIKHASLCTLLIRFVAILKEKWIRLIKH